MDEMKNYQRNTAFDFIRVLAIFAIICGHMYTFAEFNQILMTDTKSIGYYLSYFLKVIGLIENNIFFLIMGIYLKGTDIKKVLLKAGKLYINIIIISIICFIVFTVFFRIPITTDLLLVSFIPFSMNGYWFLSVYILVLLLSPFINSIWDIISKKYIIGIFLLFFYIIVIILSVFGTEKIITGGEYSISFAVLLFVTGKLIGEYGNHYKNLWGFIYLFLTIVTFLYVSVIKYTVFEFNIIERMINGSNKLIPFILSVSIVCFAKQRNKIFNSSRLNKVVSIIAKSSLMIYIVHCNKYFIRFVFPYIRFIWEKTTIPYIIYILGVSLTLLILLTVLNVMIEYIEKYLVRRLTNNAR